MKNCLWTKKSLEYFMWWMVIKTEKLPDIKKNWLKHDVKGNLLYKIKALKNSKNSPYSEWKFQS